eukprot:gene21787-28807_t
MKYCTRSSRRRALNAEDNVAPLTPSSARSSEGQDAHCASLPVQKAAITKTKLSRNSSKGTKAVGAVAAEKAEVQGAVAQVGAETKRLLAQLDRMEKRLEVTTNALAELERDASKQADLHASLHARSGSHWVPARSANNVSVDLSRLARHVSYSNGSFPVLEASGTHVSAFRLARFAKSG